jgi:hypothetical protein
MAGVKGRSGAKSSFDEQRAAEICQRLATGETLTRICRDETMPCPVTVYNWMEARPDFREQVARARKTGFDAIAESCMDIADSSTPDEAQVSKLRVWTRMELLKKWDPKRYGELQRLSHEGQDGGPIVVQWIGDQQQ